MSVVPAVLVDYMDANNIYALDLPSVTGISFKTGRTFITDQWSGTTMRIFGRNPDDVTAAPTIGSGVRVRWDGDNFCFGVVKDWRVIYGTVPAMDTWELSLESGWNVAGRQALAPANVTTGAGVSTFEMAQDIELAANTGIDYMFAPFDGPAPTYGWGSTTSAQVYSGQLVNAATDCLQTEQGVIRDYGEYSGGKITAYTEMYGRNSTALYQPVCTFSDAGTIGTYGYDSIEFLSAAYNLGAKVTVSATGFAEQVSGAGQYAQNFSTINGSASEALDLAAYLKAGLDSTASVPFRLSTNGAVAGTDAVLFASPLNVKNTVTLVFRGSTYECVIEGIEFDADPSNWRVVYTLSSSLQNAFFRLGSDVFGILDENRLGF